MSREGRTKKKDNKDSKLLEVSAESGNEESAPDASQASLMELVRHLLLQDQRRAELDRQRMERECEKDDREKEEKALKEAREKVEKAEKEQSDREWKLKMEEREEQRKKDEFEREERRHQRMEQERKDWETAEAARRRAGSHGAVGQRSNYNPATGDEDGQHCNA